MKYIFVSLKLSTQPRLGNHNNYVKTHHYLFKDFWGKTPYFHTAAVVASPPPPPVKLSPLCIGPLLVAVTQPRKGKIYDPLCLFSQLNCFSKHVTLTMLKYTLSRKSGNYYFPLSNNKRFSWWQTQQLDLVAYLLGNTAKSGQWEEWWIFNRVFRSQPVCAKTINQMHQAK